MSALSRTVLNSCLRSKAGQRLAGRHQGGVALLHLQRSRNGPSNSYLRSGSVQNTKHFEPQTSLFSRQFSSSAPKEETKEESTTTPEETNKEDLHIIIKNDEKVTGAAEKLEFQAETRMLLDIVAKSLYSESEIFVRELISNASDALEKFRYLSKSGEAATLTSADRPLEIHLGTDKHSRTFTIQDTGIGMTKEEMIENLGTIAKSGTKAFLEKINEARSGSGGAVDSSTMIGQFGVGFYSSFMVANKVDVYSKSSKSAVGYKWTSDGYGSNSCHNNILHALHKV